MPEYLKPSQVSELYGYSRSTLLRYERDGKLAPHRTPGGQRRYTEADIRSLTNAGVEISSEPVPANLIHQEFGVINRRRWTTSIYDEPMKELRGLNGRKLLHEMRIGDPIISAIFFAIESSLKRSEWRVAPASEGEEDIKAAEFIDSCLSDMTFTWSDTLSFILVMLEQGYSVIEVVYKKRMGENPVGYISNPASSKHNDGRVGWRKWSPRPAETLPENDAWVYDDSGGIQGVYQEVNRGNKFETIFLPINKLLLFRTTVAPNNNPEGMPIHRAMYESWWFAKNIAEIEGIGIERDLAGIPIVYLGEDTTTSGANSDFELAKELVVNLRTDEQAGIVIPRPKMGMGREGQGILVELLSSTGSRRHDTNAIIERYDKRKAVAILAQFILLGMERVGSFALSKTQSDLFTIAISSWLNSVADVINQYAIPRLMSYNTFSVKNGYPKLVPGPVGVPDLEGISNFVNTMVGSTIIQPDNELERHLRQLAGLPPKLDGAEVRKPPLPSDKPDKTPMPSQDTMPEDDAGEDLEDDQETD